MAMGSALHKKIEAKLIYWDKQLARWNEYMENGTEGTRIEHRHVIEHLRSRRNVGQALLSRLKGGDAPEHNDLQDVVEYTCYQIDRAFEQAASRLL